FGLAGLRLGFAMGDPAIVEALRRRLGPWAVPGPALAIGQRALADAEWIDQARRRLADDAARLDALLRAAGCEIVGG
ncbi:aminotransferase class I/II-fold pyridoxal phosphate-dependent enzyme, partial [Acinetobacter baumannii]